MPAQPLPEGQDLSESTLPSSIERDSSRLKFGLGAVFLAGSLSLGPVDLARTVANVAIGDSDWLRAALLKKALNGQKDVCADQENSGYNYLCVPYANKSSERIEELRDAESNPLGEVPMSTLWALAEGYDSSTIGWVWTDLEE